MPSRPRDKAAGLQPGEIEIELGVPIPGAIVPPEQWARTALKQLPPPGPIDWDSLFERHAPVVLDLGCGNGRFVIASAVRRPECNHLGLDILPLVIRYATRRGNQRGLHHVRFAVCGAFEFLADYVAPGSVAEIHLYHPQPFRDVERAYKRLITPEFLALLHRSLAPDGLWVLQTDNPAYWKYITSIATNWFEFTEQAGPWPEDPQGRTRREIMAREQGLRIYRGSGRPRSGISAEQSQQWIRELPLPRFDARDFGDEGFESNHRSRSGRGGRGGRRGGGRGGRGGRGGGPNRRGGSGRGP